MFIFFETILSIKEKPPKKGILFFFIYLPPKLVRHPISENQIFYMLNQLVPKLEDDIVLELNEFVQKTLNFFVYDTEAIYNKNKIYLI